MHTQNTTPPRSHGRQQRSGSDFDGRPPIPGEATEEFIRQLRDGDTSDLWSEDDAAEEEEERDACIQLATAVEKPSDHSLGQLKLPPVLQRVFGTEAEGELLALARFLDARGGKKLTLLFHTPFGTIKCPAKWCSHEPEHLSQCKDLLLVMVRSSTTMFSPDPGVELRISFEEHPMQPIGVTCLSRPMQLYAGVGVDLLCFLPHTVPMEKNGRLRDGVPSVVSGDASDAVDPEGEPYVEGEKTASMADDTEQPPRENFDKPRKPVGE